MSKEFKKKNINRELIWRCLSDFGAESLSKDQKTSTQYHLKGVYDGNPFLFNIFENSDGTTTIGHATGQNRELFEVLAEEIVRCCSFGEKERLELSIPRFPTNDFDNLLEYLKSEGASIQDKKRLPYDGAQYRWQGPNGDTLTIKSFNNGTVQFQGKHAHLASLVWDYLYNVLSLEDALTKQSKTYEINVTVNEIKTELEAKIPVSHQFLEDTVRKQLSSALMLCKIGVHLEDYSAVAFPALRGLEGFIKQVLLKSGLRPADKSNIGEYFKQEVAGKYVLQKGYADHVGSPYVNILANSYTFYFNQRHGLFHMTTHVETSRILGSFEDARQIVSDVFDMIEDASKELCT